MALREFVMSPQEVTIQVISWIFVCRRDEVIFVRVLKTKYVVLLSLMGMKFLNLSLRNQSVSDYT